MATTAAHRRGLEGTLASTHGESALCHMGKTISAFYLIAFVVACAVIAYAIGYEP
jgi:hypothetical protein